MVHAPHWLLLTLSLVAVAAGLMEVRFLRRGAGNRWWLLAYIALGIAFLLYALQSK